MGKLCWINGQPYSVGLPTGGKDKNDRNNQWDKMIDFLGEDSNAVFHWSRVFSWCQNEIAPSHCAVRGGISDRHWDHGATAHTSSYVGFRPVLYPLNPETLRLDPSLLADIPDGRKIALASLYVDGKPVNLNRVHVLCYKGEGTVSLGNRVRNKNYWLYVIKHGNLLWADRNILVDISWDELRKQGFAD